MVDRKIPVTCCPCGQDALSRRELEEGPNRAHALETKDPE